MMKYDYYMVEGKSMYPTIKPDQKFKILKTKNVKIGDIVVFEYKKNPNKKKLKWKSVVHRIIKIKGNEIITKGDNKIYYDSSITFKNIVGKVIQIEDNKINTKYYNTINRIIVNHSKLNLHFNKIFLKVSRKCQKIFNRVTGKKNDPMKMLLLLKSLNKINRPIFRLLNRFLIID